MMDTTLYAQPFMSELNARFGLPEFEQRVSYFTSMKNRVAHRTSERRRHPSALPQRNPEPVCLPK